MSQKRDEIADLTEVQKLREDVDFLVTVVRELSEEVERLRIMISESRPRSGPGGHN